jgi:hypothetical protein
MLITLWDKGGIDGRTREARIKSVDPVIGCSAPFFLDACPVSRMIPPTMADSESDKKREQVAQVYAGMADGELQKLAEEAWTLTDIGKEALKIELARRGLKIELSKSSAPDVEVDKLVVLRQFRDLPEALLAKGALESAGIECFLADDITIRMDWLWSNALGGIKLCVKSEDADAAAQLLDQGIPEGFEVTGAGEYKQPHCPKCHCMDISFEDLNKPVAYTGIFLGVPIPLSRRRWKCNSCGKVWQEPEGVSEQEPQHEI